MKVAFEIEEDVDDNQPDAWSSTRRMRSSDGVGAGGEGGGGEFPFLARLRSSRTFTLSLFTVVVVLLFSDQNLMAPNLSAIAAEFGFDDKVKRCALSGCVV